MRKQIHTNFRVPEFANLTLGVTGYEIHITLPVSKYAAEYIQKVHSHRDSFIFQKKNKYYFRTEAEYDYDVSITEALYKDAYQMLDSMKLIIRKAKIQELEDQIKEITDKYNS